MRCLIGQYYLVVNLDRQEFINPSGCGDGLKLLELCDTLKATYLMLTPLQAFAALATTGSNGSGGGDLALRYDYSKNKLPDGLSFSQGRKLGFLQDSTPSPLFDVIGSWGGDRIAVAGDYGRDLDLLPKELHKQAWAEAIEEHKQYLTNEAARSNKPKKPYRRQDVREPNLYHWAEKHFTDITEKVMAVFTACGEGPFAPKTADCWAFEVQELAANYLWRDFTMPCEAAYREAFAEWEDQKQRAKAVGLKFTQKPPVFQQDLTWMPLQMLDSLVRRAADSPARLASLKKYLKAQKLSALVRSLLPHYKAHNSQTGEERHNFKKIEALCNFAGFHDQNHREQQRVLPQAEFAMVLSDIPPWRKQDLLRFLRAVKQGGKATLTHLAADFAFGKEGTGEKMGALPFTKDEFLDFVEALSKLGKGKNVPKTLVEGVRRWLAALDHGEPTTNRERVISLEPAGS